MTDQPRTVSTSIGTTDPGGPNWTLVTVQLRPGLPADALQALAATVQESVRDWLRQRGLPFVEEETPNS